MEQFESGAGGAGPAFKDRRAALMVVGILEMVLGLGAWGMAGLIVFGALLGARGAGVSMGPLVPGLVMYGVSGLVFLGLGVGSMRARRWARDLWLVISVGWLLCGVMSLVGAAFWLPALFRGAPAGQPTPPPGVMMVVMAMVLIFLVLFMIVVPLALFLFYRSPHVRATCEAAQPEPGWTSGRPLPVLAAALWFGVMAAMMAGMPVAYGGLFPCFGRFVGGAAGWFGWWVVAAGCAVAASGLYQRRRAAWWLALTLLVLLSVSAVVTYAVADIGELYRAMGIQGAQMTEIERMGFTRPGFLVGSALAGILPFVALLIWIRGHMDDGAKSE